MVPYVLLAAYTALIWYFHEHTVIGRRAFLVMALVPAALLLGLRASTVGEDTAMYLRMADVADALPWSDLNPFGADIIWEPDQWGYGSAVNQGYLLYCKVVMALFGDARAVLLVTAGITCLLIGVFIERNAKDVGPAYWFFLCGGLYMFAFNGMRQALALAIAVNYYQLAREKKWGWAVIVILIASLIHRSALVMLGLLILQGIMGLKWTYWISIGIALLLPALVRMAYPLVRWISPQFASYYTNNYWSVSFHGVILVWAVIVCCCISLGRKRGDDESFAFLSFCSISYLALMLSAAAITIIERVGLYLLAIICISYERALGCIGAKNRWWVTIGGGLLLLALYLSYAASPVRTYVLCF